jgi:hypothetical protein
MFVRLLYDISLEVKESVLLDSPSTSGLANVCREMDIMKGLITKIVLRGGVAMPSLASLSIPETKRKAYQERNDKYIPFFTFEDGSRQYADGLVEENIERDAPGRLNPDYVEPTGDS